MIAELIQHQAEQDKPNPRGKQPQARYDGVAKVTGKAKYAAEFKEPFPKDDLLYAYIVQSTIPNGTIASMDRTVAERAPGVVAVLTPFNAPKLSVPPPQPPARRNLTILQDTNVAYNGQPIAVVVAKSLAEAREGARLLKIKYSEQPAKLDFHGRLGEARWPKQPGKEPPGNKRGDLAKGFSQATVTVEQTYVTPIQVHNPMEPHATIAWWEGEKLNFYDSTQYISGVKQTIAKLLSLPARRRARAVPVHRRGLRLQGLVLVAPAALRHGSQGRRQTGQTCARPRADVWPCRLPSDDGEQDQAWRYRRRQAHGHAAGRGDARVGPRRLHGALRRPDEDALSKREQCGHREVGGHEPRRLHLHARARRGSRHRRPRDRHGRTGRKAEDGPTPTTAGQLRRERPQPRPPMDLEEPARMLQAGGRPLRLGASAPVLPARRPKATTSSATAWRPPLTRPTAPQRRPLSASCPAAKSWPAPVRRISAPACTP